MRVGEVMDACGDTPGSPPVTDIALLLSFTSSRFGAEPGRVVSATACVSINKADFWATKTMNKPKHPLERFLRVITVSLETMKIVDALPPLDIRSETT